LINPNGEIGAEYEISHNFNYEKQKVNR
jgi:hypothetical protein